MDLEDLEPFTGKITNEGKIVSEIGSDKVVFNDADIIVTKIDPYLGYTFLNDRSKPIIGTTELLPYIIEEEIVIPDFIKYILLSKEYIFKSNLLMYGKRHPRIHPLDLLNIKIPSPDLETQQKIVAEIQEREKINDIAKSKIKAIREEINKIIWTTLTDGGRSHEE